MPAQSDSRLPLAEIMDRSSREIMQNLRVWGLAALINWPIMWAGVAAWKTIFFFPILLAAYVFWCVFFRYYFKRKPYFDFAVILHSTVPSSKIVVLSVLLGTLIAVMPLVPLFIGLPAEMLEKYQRFLVKYMQESSIMDLGLNLLVILVSPYLIYRPFLAWISALLGRSGSIISAWKRSEGYYGQFLMMSLIFNLGFVVVQQACSIADLPMAVMLLFLSPLVIYYNLIMAKVYEFFFLD